MSRYRWPPGFEPAPGAVLHVVVKRFGKGAHIIVPKALLRRRIALKPGKARFIQVTHPSGVAERVAKILTRIKPELLDSPVFTWEVWERVRDGFTVRLVKGGLQN